MVVAPRKVKTMVVRSDGTLVAREDPTPAARRAGDRLTPRPPPPAAATALAPAGNDETGAVAKSEEPTFRSTGGRDLFAETGLQPSVAVARQPRRRCRTRACANPGGRGHCRSRSRSRQPAAARAGRDEAGEAKPEEVATANVEPAAVAYRCVVGADRLAAERRKRQIDLPGSGHALRRA